MFLTAVAVPLAVPRCGQLQLPRCFIRTVCKEEAEGEEWLKASPDDSEDAELDEELDHTGEVRPQEKHRQVLHMLDLFYMCRFMICFQK